MFFSNSFRDGFRVSQVSFGDRKASRNKFLSSGELPYHPAIDLRVASKTKMVQIGQNCRKSTKVSQNQQKLVKSNCRTTLTPTVVIGWDLWTPDLFLMVIQKTLLDLVYSLYSRWLNIFCSLEVWGVLDIFKLCLVNRERSGWIWDTTFLRCKVDDSAFQQRILAGRLALKSKTSLRKSPVPL